MRDARLELRVERSLVERIDLVRGEDVPRSRWIVRAIERALEGAPFPVVVENLVETPEGRVVMADPETPASYVQHRPPSVPRQPLGRFELGGAKPQRHAFRSGAEWQEAMRVWKAGQ